jgi:hypothetical protein
MATRPTPDVPFGKATRLPAPVNVDAFSAFMPFVTQDWPAPGSELYFVWGEDPWISDLYVATWRAD